MSYEQCMKWHKKRPKGGKPQYLGFDAGTGSWPSPHNDPHLGPRLAILRWWGQRHNPMVREAIREQIADARMAKKGGDA